MSTRRVLERKASSLGAAARDRFVRVEAGAQKPAIDREKLEQLATPEQLETLGKYGLEPLELKAFPEADRILAEVIAGKIDITTEAGKKEICERWPADCPPPFVPHTLELWHKFYPDKPYPPGIIEGHGDYWYLGKQKDGDIVSNLNGKAKPVRPSYGSEIVFIEKFSGQDWDAEDGRGEKLLQTDAFTSKVLTALGLEQKGAVNISREQLDEALWEGDPGQREPSKKSAELIKELGYDPKEWEFRLNNQRETEGEHNLLYYQDNYFLVDGKRNSFLGGYRGHGGASFVGLYSRGRAFALWAVRLVLSPRKN